MAGEHGNTEIKSCPIDISFTTGPTRTGFIPICCGKAVVEFIQGQLEL